MDTLVPIALVGIAVVVVASIPLIVRDRISAKRAERELREFADWVATNGPKLGYRMRMEIGPLSPDELELFWTELTNHVAVDGLRASRETVVQMAGVSRRKAAELQSNPDGVAPSR